MLVHNVRTAAHGLRQGMPVEFVAFDVTEALQAIARGAWGRAVLARC